MIFAEDCPSFQETKTETDLDLQPRNDDELVEFEPGGGDTATREFSYDIATPDEVLEGEDL